MVAFLHETCRPHPPAKRAACVSFLKELAYLLFASKQLTSQVKGGHDRGT